MGSFAIQVMTGKENNVKKLMEWAFARNESAQKWVKAIHTFTQGTRRLLGKDEMGKRIERAQIPGYVFVEMSNDHAAMPADIWHLIKSVPGVIRLFANAGQIIGTEVMDQLFSGLDCEDQVEASLPLPEATETASVQEAEKKVQQSLNEVNMADTPSEKRGAEIRLETAIADENAILSVEHRPEVGPITKQLIGVKEKVKTFLKHQKEVIRFPVSLFTRIKKHVDPEGAIPESQMNRPSFFIPLMVDILVGEAKLE